MIRVWEFPHSFFMEKSGFYKANLLHRTHVYLGIDLIRMSKKPI
ncbi:hypothetical protein LEP1GSC034_1779 [Leptospira interrogans str. 2003000735]|uniref:Uncharacterized protein n=4 Tax=Leptospira interrogans TaxID=173 RepID=A0A0E2DIZ3_LEPIR|nr:hypothetical protein G436_0596 [Leptospira interrogans serovar Hardjo str. Norma]EKR55604.1 hypothetical protein LEP1GSC105_2477 [Leptospira interrogans str. UI 12758]EMJ35717.1 hypothetical protein LEP1GSC079_1234 [Leptospira interrogans str. FPW1039]EMJ72952.1 hypothetical protein LEP1GSC034_1779 [Leptospira interrogans str. 2003000735]EMO93938.1 hypothetical protein LEP1GSC109_3832 [Leptospira interrogans str. UI 13372]EMY25710.1 hypothetical protein LEP1GSC115_4921 [Leptospira interroga